MEIFAFCVITVEPIKIQTCSAPQNDHLNLSFVKEIYVVCENMARKGLKSSAIWAVANFVDQSL